MEREKRGSAPYNGCGLVVKNCFSNSKLKKLMGNIDRVISESVFDKKIA